MRRIIKRCIVPSCTNTNINAPNKLFLAVPKNSELREKWSLAIRKIISNIVNFCCEDHFDLQEDAENWMRYKLAGNVKLRLKKTVVPHIFTNAQSKIKRITPSHLAQKRLEKEVKEQEKRKAADIKEKLLNRKCKSVQVRNQYESKAIQCSFKLSETYKNDFNKPVMMVFESTDEEIEHDTPIIYESAAIHSTRKKCEKSTNIINYNNYNGEIGDNESFTTPTDLALDNKNYPLAECNKQQYNRILNISDIKVEETSQCDKEVQVFIQPPFCNKGVICKLPIFPLSKPTNRRSFTKPRILKKCASNNKSHFRLFEILNSHNDSIITMKNCNENLETKSDKRKFKKFKVETELLHVKQDIKQEIADYEEISIIKHEIEDPDDKSVNLFLEYSKPEPYFEESTDMDTSFT